MFLNNLEMAGKLHLNDLNWKTLDTTLYRANV